MCGSGLSAFSSRRMDVRVQANTKITTPAIMLHCYLYLFRFKSRMGSDSKTQRRGQREEISSPLQATYLTEPLSGGSFEFFTLVTPAVAITPPYSPSPPPASFSIYSSAQRNMYSNCSEKYWNERKKPDVNKRKVFIASGLTLALIGATFYICRNVPGRNKPESFRRLRLDNSESQRQRCELYVKDIRDECINLCSNERASIPRPTMHQACLHGCEASFHDAAFLACRQESEDQDAFRQVGHSSYEHCEKYQNALPRPEVLSTCRKYYREGAKSGKRFGTSYITYLAHAELGQTVVK